MKNYFVNFNSFCISFLLLSVKNSNTLDPEYYPIPRFKQAVTVVFNTIIEFIDKILNNPKEFEVRFWCATPFRHDIYYKTGINDPKVELKLDKRYPVAFFIHGWTDNAHRKHAQRIAREYSNNQRSNVCCVDWDRISKVKYSIAAKKTAYVGYCLAMFINYLQKQLRIPYNEITLIGHSMGAHVAGVAGNLLDGQIGRIYGLDTAGPHFTTSWASKFLFARVAPLELRLHRGSAHYVQCIHTDANIVGSKFSCGHQNFFPNGGITPQPGCLMSIFNGGIAMNMITCSHSKSMLYFEASLNPYVYFPSSLCESYSKYSMGKCNNNPSDQMGIRASGLVSGNFYLNTSREYPFGTIVSRRSAMSFKKKKCRSNIFATYSSDCYGIKEYENRRDLKLWRKPNIFNWK